MAALVENKKIINKIIPQEKTELQLLREELNALKVQLLEKKEVLVSKNIITKDEALVAKQKRKLDEQCEKDQSMVRGIFRNHETPGAGLKFAFKHYKEIPLKDYDLQDETIYNLPLGVVKHLNNNTWYPQHAHTLDKDGKPAVNISKKVRRFSFSPVDFVDESEFSVADKEIVIATPL